MVVAAEVVVGRCWAERSSWELNEPDPRYASVAAAMANAVSFRGRRIAVKRCAREMQASFSSGDSYSQ